MIIYPAIILGLLLIGFIIIYRRAYLVENVPELKQRAENETVFYEASTPEVNPFDQEEENFNKAEELFKKKQYISAERWYIEAVKKNPKNSVIFSRLAVIYLDQKNYSDAIESLSEALKLSPNSAINSFNLSFAYNAQGNQKDAMILAKKALRLDPKNKKYKKWLDQLRTKPF